ncbi:hypothetical protein AVEN_21360-1, partial [Araneus ventricosus]
SEDGIWRVEDDLSTFEDLEQFTAGSTQGISHNGIVAAVIVDGRNWRFLM